MGLIRLLPIIATTMFNVHYLGILLIICEIFEICLLYLIRIHRPKDNKLHTFVLELRLPNVELSDNLRSFECCTFETYQLQPFQQFLWPHVQRLPPDHIAIFPSTAIMTMQSIVVSLRNSSNPRNLIVVVLQLLTPDAWLIGFRDSGCCYC